MHTLTRKLAPAAAALSAAALTLGLLAPPCAVARGAGQPDRSAIRAAREQQRATRSEERATRAQERATRRATREQERAARRAARSGSPGEQRVEAGAAGNGGEARTDTPAPQATAPSRPAAPTGSADLARCRVTVASSSNHITAGETVTIFGKLTCPPQTSPAERQITILQGEQGAHTASFTALGAATTEADGAYELTSLAFDTNTTFRVRVGNRGARTVVTVAPVVTLSGPSPAAKLSTVAAGPFGAHPAKVTFTGTVQPAQEGARVSLQVAYAVTGEQWRTVAFAGVGADGGYSVAHGFRTAGQASVRVVVHMHGRHAVAASEPLTYEVAQAQNPKLTIQSSAAPVAYGQSVTIGGVAVEAGERTITLLARTHGGQFAPVATATTDASGNYSFTQAPTQSTSYRVTLGPTSSTVLFEGVRRALLPDAPPSAVPAGQQVAFTGTVTPADEGQAVYAERENASGIGFHVVASSTVGPTGYSIAHAFANAGSYTMRIRVPGDPALQATTSAPFTFLVTSAPAATLTPEAPVSPQPSSSGSPAS